MAIKVLNDFLPPAESLKLGGIKVGSTLSIDETGILQTSQEYTATITNRITQIPRDIKVEMSGTNLVLKAGSVVYIPNGFEADDITRKFTKVTVSSDITMQGWTNLQGLIVINTTGTGYTFSGMSQTFAGGSATLGDGNLWYDTTTNTMKRCDNGTSWNSGYSLPICVVTSNGSSTTGVSGIAKVDEVFNGFGYIANTIFALPGIHGIIPYGLNDNSTPNVLSLLTERVCLFTASKSQQTETIYISNTSIIGSNQYTYDYTQNVNRDQDGNISLTVRSNVNYMYENGRITKFEQAFISPSFFDEKTNVVSSPMDTQFWLNGNKGRVFLNCTSAPGQYVGFTKYNSTNGVFVLGGYQGSTTLSYTDRTTINNNLNNTTKQVILLNEDGNSSFPGTVTAPTFNGTAYRTYWADLAEKYVSDDKYPVGTLICFGGEKEITIAKKKVNGVISEKPGYMLNAKSKGQPVVLVGKTKVRVIGKVNKNDRLVLYKDGIAHSKKWYEIFKRTVGIALESNSETSEKLVMSIVKVII